MVVRCGVQWNQLYGTIQGSGLLGEFKHNSPYLLGDKPAQLVIVRTPNDSSREREPDQNLERRRNQYGFWLPQGLGTDYSTFARQIDKCKQRFDRIEDAFHENEDLNKIWAERVSYIVQRQGRLVVE